MKQVIRNIIICHLILAGINSSMSYLNLCEFSSLYIYLL